MRRRSATRFALLGVLLFVLARMLATAPAPSELRAADTDVEDVLYRAALARGLDRDDPVVQARLIRDMRFLNRDESNAASLYDQALGLGLPEGDLVVRRRLIERMRLVLQEPALAAEPSDAELQDYLDAHRDRFGSPPRARLTQIFLSRQRRGAAVAADAAALLARLGEADVARASTLSDPLPLPTEFPSASQQELARLFGADFAAAVIHAAPGRWEGPVFSPYGLHLVWVQMHEPDQLPELDAVRAQVRAALRDERAEAALRDGVRALRESAISALRPDVAG